MKITRDTLRADGQTVGEAMDKDAAFLRAIGLNAKDGALPYDDAEERFIEQTRQVILNALDTVAEECTGNRNDGPKDRELPALFKAIDPIAKRMFAKRYGL